MSRPAKSLRSRPAVRLHTDVSFAAAFDNAPHAMALVGADGTLMHVNRALCRMLGFEAEELIDANLSVISHPDDLETEWEQRQRLARADIGRGDDEGLGTFDHGAHAHLQSKRGDRLAQITVNAGAARGFDIGLGAAARKHEDRERAIGQFFAQAHEIGRASCRERV